MSADAANNGSGRFALFPLNVVLFPHGLLPLRIFEPRYLRMVAECLREQKPFVVAAIVDGAEAGGVARTATTGTTARIIDWEQGDDGLLGLLCEGEQRVVLSDVDADPDQLLRATATSLPDADEQTLPEELRWAAELLDELLDRLGEPYTRLHRDRPSADHVANRLIELLPLPVNQKQALFDLGDGAERLHRLAGLIERRP